MTTPTREEIITAHEALETLTDTCIHSSEQAEELQELVLRALPPKPRPTMAEVEWDDEEHFLAEAKIKNGPLVAMIGESRDQWIICIPIETYPSLLHMRTEFEGYLTLTGKRYTLTEVQDD